MLGALNLAREAQALAPHALPSHLLAQPTPQPSGGGTGPGDLFNGLHPDWGPFKAVGDEAKTIIDILIAAAGTICFGIAVLGASKIRIGNNDFVQDPIAVRDGRKLIIGGLTGVFLIAAMGAIFTIVWGMGGGIRVG